MGSRWRPQPHTYLGRSPACAWRSSSPRPPRPPAAPRGSPPRPGAVAARRPPTGARAAGAVREAAGPAGGPPGVWRWQMRTRSLRAARLSGCLSRPCPPRAAIAAPASSPSPHAACQPGELTVPATQPECARGWRRGPGAPSINHPGRGRAGQLPIVREEGAGPGRFLPGYWRILEEGGIPGHQSQRGKVTPFRKECY